MPAASASGARIGTMIITPGSGSMKMPHQQQQDIDQQQHQRLKLQPRSIARHAAEPDQSVSTQANTAEADTMIIRIDAVTSAVRKKCVAACPGAGCRRQSDRSNSA
jgi:hypothetical protein